jgi:hypothetical protein
VWKAEVWPDIKGGARPGRLTLCLLRGRGRSGPEAAEGPHLGPARRPARRAGARRRHWPQNRTLVRPMHYEFNLVTTRPGRTRAYPNASPTTNLTLPAPP